jgi:hypothetical protein
VSNSSGSPSTPPGWYPDPAGSRQQRWWDGSSWTEHLQDPVVGQGAVPAVGLQIPVYNLFIWLIVLVPLISIAGVVNWDMSSYMQKTVDGQTAAALLDGGYLLLLGLGFLVYAAIVVLSYFDYRALKKVGIVRPFHWAWSFLSGTVYVIGRSVIVKRRSGRGLLPIWILIAVIVISIVVSVVKAAAATASIMSTLNLPS